MAKRLFIFFNKTISPKNVCCFVLFVHLNILSNTVSTYQTDITPMQAEVSGVDVVKHDAHVLR